MMRHLLIISALFFTHHLSAQGKFDGGDGDGFATTTISNIVLPLEIIDFTVNKNNGSITAQLRIVSTDNICRLQLERSGDGSRFAMADEQQAQPPGLPGDVFYFNDGAAPGGTLYYRVKILRCDGTYLFSKTVLLAANDKERWVVAGKILLYQTAITGQLQCYNQSGQLIYTRQLNSGSGEIALPVVATGIYLIRFNNETKGRYWVSVN